MANLRTLTAIALALGLAAPLATVPMPAAAQEACADYTLDANGDGSIAEEEFDEYEAAFDAYDANSDGMVDESEWSDCANAAFGGEPGGGDDDGPLFGLLDTTADNAVGEDEWFTEDNFSALDDNEDGVLDENEFSS